MPEIREITLFEPDYSTTAMDKNGVLAALLRGAWMFLEIVKIERIEIGSQKGWRVIYRE
jgi:hypothetical protein